MRTSPFNLPWGASVFAKITATNVKGSSSQSNQGNGAVIITLPDPPLNLAENTAVRKALTLALNWNQGVFNGASSVIDYRINIAE